MKIIMVTVIILSISMLAEMAYSRYLEHKKKPSNPLYSGYYYEKETVTTTDRTTIN